MVYRICNHCKRRYNEPIGPITFFCTQRCAKAHSNTPNKMKHKRLVEHFIMAESLLFIDLPFEEIGDQYHRDTRAAKCRSRSQIEDELVSYC